MSSLNECVYECENWQQRESRERDGRMDGQGEGTADPKCILSLSLSHSLSYVIHMIHVEPTGAGIMLTFCIQHTQTQTLPTNTKEMCPQIPSPRALCTVFVYVYVRACVQTCLSLCTAHTVLIHGCYTYSIRLYLSIL